MTNDAILGPENPAWVRVVEFHDRVCYQLTPDSRAMPPSARRCQIEYIANPRSIVQDNGRQMEIDTSKLLCDASRAAAPIKSDSLHFYDIEDLSQCVPVLVSRSQANEDLTWISEQDIVHMWPKRDKSSRDRIETANLVIFRNMMKKILSSSNIQNNHSILLHGEGDLIKDATMLLGACASLIRLDPQETIFRERIGSQSIWMHLQNYLNFIFCDEGINLNAGIEFKMDIASYNLKLEAFLDAQKHSDNHILQKYYQWSRSTAKRILESLHLSVWTLQSASWASAFSTNLLTTLPKNESGRTTMRLTLGTNLKEQPSQLDSNPRAAFGHRLSVTWAALVTRSLKEGLLSKVHEVHGVSTLCVARYIKSMELNSLIIDSYSTLYIRNKRKEILPFFIWLKAAQSLKLPDSQLVTILKYALAAEYLDVCSRISLCVKDSTKTFVWRRSIPYLLQSLKMMYPKQPNITKMWENKISKNPYWLFTLQDICYREICAISCNHINSVVFAGLRSVEVNQSESYDKASSTCEIRLNLFPHPVDPGVIDEVSLHSSSDQNLLTTVPIRLAGLPSILSDYQSSRLWSLIRFAYFDRDAHFCKSQRMYCPPYDSQLSQDLLDGQTFRKKGGLLDLFDNCVCRLACLDITSQSTSAIVAEAKRFAHLFNASYPNLRSMIKYVKRGDIMLELVLWTSILLFTENELSKFIADHTVTVEKQTQHQILDDLLKLNLLTKEEDELFVQVQKIQKDSNADEEAQNRCKLLRELIVKSMEFRERQLCQRIKPFNVYYTASRDAFASILDFRLLIRDFMISNPYVLANNQTSKSKIKAEIVDENAVVNSWYADHRPIPEKLHLKADCYQGIKLYAKAKADEEQARLESIALSAKAEAQAKEARINAEMAVLEEKRALEAKLFADLSRLNKNSNHLERAKSELYQPPIKQEESLDTKRARSVEFYERSETSSEETISKSIAHSPPSDTHLTTLESAERHLEYANRLKELREKDELVRKNRVLIARALEVKDEPEAKENSDSPRSTKAKSRKQKVVQKLALEPPPAPSQRSKRMAKRKLQLYDVVTLPSGPHLAPVQAFDDLDTPHASIPLKYLKSSGFKRPSTAGRPRIVEATGKVGNLRKVKSKAKASSPKHTKGMKHKNSENRAGQSKTKKVFRSKNNLSTNESPDSDQRREDLVLKSPRPKKSKSPPAAEKKRESQKESQRNTPTSAVKDPISRKVSIAKKAKIHSSPPPPNNDALGNPSTLNTPRTSNVVKENRSLSSADNHPKESIQTTREKQDIVNTPRSPKDPLSNRVSESLQKSPGISKDIPTGFRSKGSIQITRKERNSELQAVSPKDVPSAPPSKGSIQITRKEGISRPQAASPVGPLSGERSKGSIQITRKEGILEPQAVSPVGAPLSERSKGSIQITRKEGVSKPQTATPVGPLSSERSKGSIQITRKGGISEPQAASRIEVPTGQRSKAILIVRKGEDSASHAASPDAVPSGERSKGSMQIKTKEGLVSNPKNDSTEAAFKNFDKTSGDFGEQGGGATGKKPNSKKSLMTAKKMAKSVKPKFMKVGNHAASKPKSLIKAVSRKSSSEKLEAATTADISYPEDTFTCLQIGETGTSYLGPDHPHAKMLANQSHYLKRCATEIDSKVKELHDIACFGWDPPRKANPAEGNDSSGDENVAASNGSKTKKWCEVWTITGVERGSGAAADDQRIYERLYQLGTLALIERGLKGHIIRHDYLSFCRLFSYWLDTRLRQDLAMIGNEKAAPELLDRCKEMTSRILAEVYGISSPEYRLGSTCVFMRARSYSRLTLADKGRSSVDADKKAENLRSCVQTLIDRWRYHTMKASICRIQARWRLRLWERRMGNNIGLFYPLFHALVVCASLLIPYNGIHDYHTVLKPSLKNLAKPNLSQFQTSAAIVIQCWWRGIMAQRDLRLLKERKLYSDASEVIQALARTMLAVSGLKIGSWKTYYQADLDRAATKIQKTWRGRRGKSVLAYKELSSGLCAMILPIQRISQTLVFATTISSRWKAKKLAEGRDSTGGLPGNAVALGDALGRSLEVDVDDRPSTLSQVLQDNYLLRAENYKALVKIQSCWRGYFIRNQYRALQRACQIVQTFMHTQLARRRFVATRRCVVKIQKWWRMILQYRKSGLHHRYKDRDDGGYSGASGLRFYDRNRALVNDRIITGWINIFLTSINITREQNMRRRRIQSATGKSVIDSMNKRLKDVLKAVEMCHLGFTAFYAGNDREGKNDLYRDPRDFRVCFVADLQHSADWRHDWKSYEKFGGWSWPIFVLLRRYMIAALFRLTRRSRSHVKFDSDLTNSEETRTSIKRLTYGEIDAVVEASKLQADARIIAEAVNVEIEKRIMKDEEPLLEAVAGFTREDVRAITAPFEHFVNLSKSQMTLVSRSLHLERNLFELRSIVLGSRTSYLIIAESLDGFLGKKIDKHSLLMAQLQNEVSCLFAWGANDQMQLTYTHDSTYSQFAPLDSEKVEVVDDGRPQRKYRTGLNFIRFEHEWSEKQAQTIWRQALAKKKKLQWELRQMRNVLSARQLVEAGMAMDSSSDDEVHDDTEDRRSQMPDFRRAVTRRVDYSFQIIEVQAGEDFAVARTNDGRLFSWGDNSDGRCGQGRRFVVVPKPMMIPMINRGNRKVLQYSVGLRHCMCVVEGNRVYVWGAHGFVHLLRNKKSGGGTRRDLKESDLDCSEDIYYPAEVPLDEILRPRLGSDNLELIMRRESYKYDVEEPGFEFREFIVKRPAPGDLPRFDNQREHNSFERLDMREDGRQSDDDSEDFGRDPKNWREKMKKEQAEWIKAEEARAKKREEIRRLRRLWAEQKERRMLRKEKWRNELKAAQKAAYDAAVARFNATYGGLSPAEVEEKAAKDPSVVVVREGKQIRVSIVADDIVEPKLEPDSGDEVKVPADDGEPESWKSFWGTYPGKEIGSKRDLVDAGLMKPEDLERGEALNIGYDYVMGEKPPTISPPGRPRDVHKMSWRGITKFERRWLELMLLIRSQKWDVQQVVAGRGHNLILLRCRNRDFKDILLTWGKNDVGQLGLMGRQKKAGGDSATFGWCPLFMWFGSLRTLRDSTFQIEQVVCGIDYAAALCRGFNNKRNIIFLWGCFPVLGYNLLRKKKQSGLEKLSVSSSAAKAAPAATGGLSLLRKKGERAAAATSVPETDPYSIPEFDRKLNTTDYWVVGRVSFPFPLLVESVTDDDERILDISASQAEYNLLITTTNRGTGPMGRASAASGRGINLVYSVRRFIVVDNSAASKSTSDHILDQTSFVFTPLVYDDLKIQLKPDATNLWLPDTCVHPVATNSTGHMGNNYASVVYGASAIEKFAQGIDLN